ncbi:MAG TPA: DNA polymerase III subunit gamma/tau, partial [Gemmatimonadaceae bacterium]|nr:DNA polymerase III subunit gamma/tau [Gemmatimonadaceae bacterium]
MIALARKYRPRNFASVAVQSHVSNTLKGAIARGRVAHGYLLCGPRGVGKTTLARVLAMALNCENRSPDGEPCGVCESCRRIWSGSASLDVIEIDAASNRGVDDARELRERAMYAPSGDDRYKVYIVDEAHMLTREAWNALLKVLEEPPPRVVFVFATTDPQKIAQAAAPVLSRLQRFDFRRIGPADVRARLESVLADEHIPAEPEALAMIARAADGSMRDALSLTDQSLSLGDGPLTAERVRDALGLVAEDEYLEALAIIADRRAGDVFPMMQRLGESGIDFSLFLTGLADMLRAQLAVTLGSTSVEVSERARSILVERRDRLTAADLLRMLAAIGELEPRFRKSGQQQLLLETLMVRFALLDRSLAIEDVLRGLGDGGSGPNVRPPASSPSSTSGRAAGMSTGPGPADTPRRSAGDSTPSDRPAPPLVRDQAPRSRGDASWKQPPSGSAVPASAADPAVATAPAPPRPRSVATTAVPSINVITERWDDIVASLRSSRMLLAPFLEQATPSAISAVGSLTVQAEDEAAADALEMSKADMLAVVKSMFPAVERIAIVRPNGPATTGSPKRVTEQEIREQRITSLRKRDPVLGAAIDALDLELLD